MDFFQNRKTGKVFAAKYFDAKEKRLFRLKRRLRCLKRKKCVFKYFGLLTYEGDNPECLTGEVRRFFNAMRMEAKRSHRCFKYLWIVERGTRGSQRLHYHFATNVLPVGWQTTENPHGLGYNPLWTVGMSAIMRIRKPDRIQGYMLKYCSKEKQKDLGEFTGRSFGMSSNLPKPAKSNWEWHYDMPPHAFLEAVESYINSHKGRLFKWMRWTAKHSIFLDVTMALADAGDNVNLSDYPSLEKAFHNYLKEAQGS